MQQSLIVTLSTALGMSSSDLFLGAILSRSSHSDRLHLGVVRPLNPEEPRVLVCMVSSAALGSSRGRPLMRPDSFDGPQDL